MNSCKDITPAFFASIPSQRSSEVRLLFGHGPSSSVHSMLRIPHSSPRQYTRRVTTLFCFSFNNSISRCFRLSSIITAHRARTCFRWSRRPIHAFPHMNAWCSIVLFSSFSQPSEGISHSLYSLSHGKYISPTRPSTSAISHCHSRSWFMSSASRHRLNAHERDKKCWWI